MSGGGLLGDGSDTRVAIAFRGGSPTLLPVSGSGWFERRLDKTSKARLRVPFSPDCCDERIRDVHMYAHEVNVFAEGCGQWAGPITAVRFNESSVDIVAEDLTHWYKVREFPPGDLLGIDPVTAFEAVHAAALAPDPSPNFDVVGVPVGGDPVDLSTSSTVFADEVVADLADAYLDWTAFYRSVIVRDVTAFTQPVAVLRGKHFGKVPRPGMSASGFGTAVRGVFEGDGSEAYVIDADAASFYGLVVERETSDYIANPETTARLALGRNRDPWWLDLNRRNVLLPSAPISLKTLIPGVAVRVVVDEAGCRPFARDFRVLSVRREFTGKTWVSFAPLGVDL